MEGIKFGSDAALLTYCRILLKSVAAPEKARKLLTLAAKKDGNKVLSEAEAKGVEEALDKYDKQSRLFFGIF